jgi:hypothetical protein
LKESFGELSDLLNKRRKEVKSLFDELKQLLSYFSLSLTHCHRAIGFDPMLPP